MAQRTKVYPDGAHTVSFLTRNAYVFPDSVAVAHGDRRYSYRQLAERVNRLASALRGAGLGTHDRVAFLCPNIPAMLEAHFGVPAARGCSCRQHPAQLGRDRVHPPALGVPRRLRRPRVRVLLKPLDLRGVRVIRVDDTGAPGDPTRTSSAPARPTRSRAGSRTRRRRSRSTTRRARRAGPRGSCTPTAGPT